MVETSESAKHAYTYIPPSVQKSMTEHMERNMPGHLQKYRQGSGHIPEHAQDAMAAHMDKSVPGHLKQYINPYLDQNVVNPHGGSSELPAAPSPVRPVGRAAKVRGLSSNNQDNDLFTPDNPVAEGTQNPAAPPSTPPTGSSNDPYGFIMDPQKTPRNSFSVGSLGGGSTIKKAAVLGGSFIVLIILFSIASSFLNGANKAQQAKLLGLANAQSEIIRTADAASQKIKDKNLLYKAATVKISVESSQQDVIAAIAGRGKKIKDKEIRTQNPANDATLSEGDQNSRYDETYSQLLNKQLADYKEKLQSVYNSGNLAEQKLAVTANNQIKLLLGPTLQ